MPQPWEKYAPSATPSAAVQPTDVQANSSSPWEKYGTAPDASGDGAYTIHKSVFDNSGATGGGAAGTSDALADPKLLKSTGDRMFGSAPLSDSLGVVGSHLANMVTGPYHAFADGPQNPEEAQIKGTTAETGAANALGQFGLGAARMFVQPTRNAIREAVTQGKAGNYAGQNYDDQGNYKPSMFSSIEDALPMVGPLTRTTENDANKHGALPALMGLGVDIGAPEAAGGVFRALAKGAPSMAEGALNIRKGDRGFGKTPGQAILDETTGIRPETVQAQAAAKVRQDTSDINNMADAHPDPVDIQPARQSLQDVVNTAKARNNLSGVQAMQPVQDQLEVNHFDTPQRFGGPSTSAAPNADVLSPLQTARGALDLKRGLRDSFVRNWNPDAASILTRDAARGASGVLDDQLDSALGPDFASKNQRISSLIPVQDAAERMQRLDDLPQKLGDKLKAHTGALTSALFAGAAGAHSGGILGGIGGATLGFALPELLGGSTSRMAIARGMNSPLPRLVAPPLFSGNLLTPESARKQ